MRSDHNASRAAAAPAIEEHGEALRVSDVSVYFRSYHGHDTTLKASLLRIFRERRFPQPASLQALCNINLSVQRGEALAIIGANGSGKSTLLKVLSGVLRPLQGTVSVRGTRTSLIELGAGFDPELTAIENIFLNGSLYRRSRADMRERVAPILEFAELEEFGHMPLKHFSSGMFARLGFSVALDLEPDILIVDEIFAVGDERFQERCQEVFRRFLEQRKTIILATHSMNLVQSFFHRTLVLARGEAVFCGAPADAIAAYRSGKYPPRLGSNIAASLAVLAHDAKHAGNIISLPVVRAARPHSPLDVSTEYPEHWRPYLYDWWQRTYFKRIVRFDQKFWFVKCVPTDDFAAARERLAYLLGQSWSNVAEVRLLEAGELAGIREAGIELPFGASIANTYLVRFALDYSRKQLPLRSLNASAAAELIYSLWIRRRDAHAYNRVFVHGLPVFFDHLSGLLGEPRLADLDQFLMAGPDGGHAGWWRLRELERGGIPDILKLRQLESNSFAADAPDRAVAHVVSNKQQLPRLLRKVARHIYSISQEHIYEFSREAGLTANHSRDIAAFLGHSSASLETALDRLIPMITG